MSADIFTDEAWRNLPAEQWEAAESTAKLYFSSRPKLTDPMETTEVEKSVAAAAFYNALCQRYGFDSPHQVPVSDNLHTFAQNVDNAFRWLQEKSKSVLIQRRLQAGIDRAQQKYVIEGMPGPFRLDDTQIGAIQGILHEVGELIRQCDEIDETHRQRALQALRELQAELDKKVTTLGRITAWAFEMQMIAARMARSAVIVLDKSEAVLKQANELVGNVNRVMLIVGAAYAGSMALPPGTEQGLTILNRQPLALPGGHAPVKLEAETVVDAEIEEIPEPSAINH